MNIQRIEPGNRFSDAVIHNQTIYYTATPKNLENDTYIQTLSTLESINKILPINIPSP